MYIFIFPSPCFTIHNIIDHSLTDFYSILNINTVLLCKLKSFCFVILEIIFEVCIRKNRFVLCGFCSCSFSGLTVDFCVKKGAKFIIRGMRTTTDFELERAISQANKRMRPSILTVFIPSSHEYSFISSTVVRDVLVNGGKATDFIPKNVDIAKYLKKIQ